MYRVKPKFCRMDVVVCLSLLGLIATSACESPKTEPVTDAVAFEGARLILGDRSAPIENATFVVEGGLFVQVGSANEVVRRDQLAVRRGSASLSRDPRERPFTGNRFLECLAQCPRGR